MGLTPCPACQKEISAAATACPHCGHPMQAPPRGVWYQIWIWAFLIWNAALCGWLLAEYNNARNHISGLSTDMEQAGALFGATIALGHILTLWGVGALALGMAALIARK